MRIALDAMGGDFGPEPNVDGAITAIHESPELEVVLVGDQPVLQRLIAERGCTHPRLQVYPSEGFVGMEEKPTEALRKKPNCSIVVCWQLLAHRQVDAVVSAGHTGAVVAAGLRTRQFLKGVKRPGIAAPMPTLKGRTVLMDVGANPAARPEHLLQYAVMGAIYAREMLGIEQPSIGLVNIGSEDGKGNDLVRETQALFQNRLFPYPYVGSVEGRELYQGFADVVICEGFVGNVLLKAAEGLADLMLRTISQEVLGALQIEQQRAMEAFHQFTKRFQYHEFGGAPLLGVDGISIICHGSSNARTISNALKTALTHKHRRINEQIVEELAQQDVPVTV